MCGSSANTRITHVCRRQKRFHISPFRTDCWSWADNCLIALFNFSSNLVFIFVFHFISVLLVVVHAFMKWRQNIRLAPETIFGWFTWKGAFLLPHSRTQKYKIKRSSRRRHRYVSIFAICAIWKEKTTKNVCCSRQSIYTSVADFFPSFLMSIFVSFSCFCCCCFLSVMRDKTHMVAFLAHIATHKMNWRKWENSVRAEIWHDLFLHQLSQRERERQRAWVWVHTIDYVLCESTTRRWSKQSTFDWTCELSTIVKPTQKKNAWREWQIKEIH